MSVNIREISKVSAATKSAVSRKSAQTLPNNPSEKGYSAEEIKRRFYQPIFDATNSALSEIDRVVEEVNTAFGDVKDEVDNFIKGARIQEAYKVEFSRTVWTLNRNTGLYEYTVPQSEHKISNYKDIGVDMFLIDGNGNYTAVNQFDIKINGDIKFYHENNSAGYASIYVKRDGFIIGSMTTDINHIVGAAKVAKTNDYNDLDNLPNWNEVEANADILSRIISGAQTVGKANTANNAQTATYANNASVADTATRANIATKATQDEYGVNISNSYAKQNGTYSNMKVGRATNADNASKATSDGNGVNISNSYAKQSGVYPNLTAGHLDGTISATTKGITKPNTTNDTTMATTAFVKNILNSSVKVEASNVTHTISRNTSTDVTQISDWDDIESRVNFKKKIILGDLVIYTGYINNPSGYGNDYWYKLNIPGSQNLQKLVFAIPSHYRADGNGSIFGTYIDGPDVYISRDAMGNGGADRANLQYLIMVFLK